MDRAAVVIHVHMNECKQHTRATIMTFFPLDMKAVRLNMRDRGAWDGNVILYHCLFNSNSVRQGWGQARV